MQSKDLRIGNYIYDSAKNKHIVTSINDLELGLIGCSIAIKFAEQIPLTEEWLINFGFSDITPLLKTKTRNIKHYCKSYFVEKCVEQQTIFITVGSLGWTFKSVGAPLYNYVHQLQNLYFALTGEELELKSESKP